MQEAKQLDQSLRCRLWLWMLSPQAFSVNSGKSDWPGKWPNSAAADDTSPAEAVCGQTGSFIMGRRRRHASPFV